MFTEAEKLTRIITSLASESLQNLCGHNCAVSPAPTFGCDVKFSKLWTFDNGTEVVCGYRVASPVRRLRSSGGAELRNSRFQRSLGGTYVVKAKSYVFACREIELIIPENTWLPADDRTFG